jgi:hypothetical protein
MRGVVPDARLTAEGDVVDTMTSTPIPSYQGLVLAVMAGNPYVLWLSLDDKGGRHWDVVNSGGVVVQTELDRFIAENFVSS